MAKVKGSRFKVSKWILLSAAILSNAFIVFYSCLSSATTEQWNKRFTNVFAKLINNVTEKEVKVTPLQGIEIKLSNESNYKYNYIPGYSIEEIPLGSAKQIECSFSPLDATDKSIVYSVEPEGSLILNQSGSTLSAVGMKVGECVLTGRSNDGGYTSSITLNIVNTVSPVSFEATLDKSSIKVGEVANIIYEIDGGVLTHDELINFRYYDTRKLSYSYDDEIIAIDDYGVIHPIKEGVSDIQISNGDLVRNLSISIEGSSSPVSYSDLKIVGDDICRENEMILDQNTGTNNHKMIIKDGDIVLDSDDFIWESSNELLAKVDKHGVLRGFRKSTLNDEVVTITATSKLNNQSTSINVLVKRSLPSKIDYSVVVGNQKFLKPKEQIVALGDQLSIVLSFTPSSSDKEIKITCSDSNIISFINEGSLISGNILKTGKCIITVVSKTNNDVGFSIEFTVIKSGAIKIEDLADVGKYIRKSLGHAAVFMVAQIFTFLSLFMFLYDKKWWLYSSISLGEGLFISCLSELIQYFAPTRSGALLDVFIDFGGVVIGALISCLIVLLIQKKQKQRTEEEGQNPAERNHG